ncbi:MAG: tRNA uracil 4-sulfurtransferase ThiI, partial [Methanobacteriota archaeon]
QVSSQTLANLVVIQDAAALPVVRPLLALDKVETVREARAIDTFEISKGPEVCDILGPKHPATTSTLERILREESKIPLAEIARAALDASRWERLSGLLPLPSHGA